MKERNWNRPGMHASDYGYSKDHNHDKRNDSTAKKYFGKGPKGYVRKDSSIKDEVCERLCWSPDVDASEIEVIVENGIVYLRGFVDSRHAKRLAEREIEDARGLMDVYNQLIIKKQLDLEEDKIIARGDNGLFSQEIIQK